MKQSYGEKLINIESAKSLLTSKLWDYLANTDRQGPLHSPTARISDSVDQRWSQSLIQRHSILNKHENHLESSQKIQTPHAHSRVIKSDLGRKPGYF